jgi:serine/threonine protein phosphatase PrpC
MIHIRHNSDLTARSVHTQIDLQQQTPEGLERLIGDIFTLNRAHVVTLLYGKQPVVSLSVQELSESRSLGLAYLTTIHVTGKNKPALHCFYPRSRVHELKEVTYLPSRARCVLDKRIGNFAFRLPHLGDIELQATVPWAETKTNSILCDTDVACQAYWGKSRVSTSAYTAIGVGKQVNEDAALVKGLRDGSLLLGVIDGIGGRGGGVLAARALADTLATQVTSSKCFRELSALLPRELQNSYSDVSISFPALASPRMGAVLTAVKVGRSFFECVRSGDCRVGHYRISEGKAKCLWASEDQVTKGVRPTNLVHLEGGIAQSVDLSVMRHRIQPGDTLILGTDGFWKTVSASEIKAALRKHSNPSEITTQLSQIVEERMKESKSLRDNFSFIVHQHYPGRTRS